MTQSAKTKRAPGSSDRPDWPLAVVFGAGGLGLAVARRLGQTHRLLITDRDGQHLAGEITKLLASGYDAQGVRCDVTSKSDVETAAQQAATMGGARALAYVVGLSPSLGDFSAIMSVNLIGAANALEAFHDVMTPGGAALCVGSTAAHMQPAPPELLSLLDEPLAEDFLASIRDQLGAEADSSNAYMLSKKGLIRLCQRKAATWGASGLRVLSLSPGLIATPQGAGEYAHSKGKMKLFESIPTGREATMLEIAGIVDFLLSDGASYINGVDLLVDGGLIAGTGRARFA